MSSNYTKLVRRLYEYRRKLGKTQADMADELGVTQSHYSKMEKGGAAISFESLRRLYQHGGDVNYLITGVAHRTGELNGMLAQFELPGERAEFFRLMAWSVNRGLILNGSPVNLWPRYCRIARFMEEGVNGRPVWERIRRNEELSQADMAERLDINIKRYRRIEKGEVSADAEILNVLYEVWGYSPLLLLDEQSFYLDELNILWDSLREEIRIRLRRLLIVGAELIRQPSAAHAAAGSSPGVNP